MKIGTILSTLLACALLALPASAATVYSGPYATESTFSFEIWSTDGLSLDVDESDAGTDATYRCGTAAEAATTNDYTDEGTTYSIVLTATEMTCTGIITVTFNEAVDAIFYVQTYGHASANIASFVQTGDSFARIGVAGAGLTNIDLPNQTMDITGTLSTVTTATNVTTVNGLAANVLTAASTAADFRTEIQDADVESINGVTILGDGSATPFGVAFWREQEEFLQSCMEDMSKRDVRKAVRMAKRYGFVFEQCNDARMIQAGGFVR